MSDILFLKHSGRLHVSLLNLLLPKTKNNNNNNKNMFSDISAKWTATEVFQSIFWYTIILCINLHYLNLYTNNKEQFDVNNFETNM